VASAKENEELVSKTVGELVRDGEASDQRAYSASSSQHLQDVKADERKECDFEVTGVALSAVSAVGKPGVAAPTVNAPPRDMRMPLSISEAINCPAYGVQWRKAIAAEWAGLEGKKCYETVKLEEFMKPLLNFKAIFKVKFNSDGSLDKFKVRLVVGGHKAIKGQHFDETFSPVTVLSIIILRLILAIFAAYPHVTTTVADVEQAYLWSQLQENVYVRAPKGLAVPEGHVLKLLKAIYGMPQAGREFWKLLRSIKVKLGFTQSEHAHCFFYRRTDAGFIILMTYVDDITITTDCESMRKEVFDAINKEITLDDRGVIKSFLGRNIEYHKEQKYWQITQGIYINDLCASMNLTKESSKAALTPEVKQAWSTELSTAAKDDAERLRVSQFSPRSKVGSILWLIVCCRPDLMHCVKDSSQYMTDPGDMVVVALKRVGRYLLGTMDQGLRLQGYTGDVGLHVASDAVDADGVHRRSMLCCVQWIGPPLGDESELVPRVSTGLPNWDKGL
jgi:hypothetical protein